MPKSKTTRALICPPTVFVYGVICFESDDGGVCFKCPFNVFCLNALGFLGVNVRERMFAYLFDTDCGG